MAKSYFKKAAQKATQINDFYCSLEAEISLAVCEIEQGRLSDAELRLTQLRRYVPRDSHPELAAGIDLGFARLAHKRGDLDSARKRYEAHIINSRRRGLKYHLRSALVALGAIEWHSGSPARAEAMWTDALAVASADSHFKRELVETSIRTCKTNRAAAVT